MWDTYKKHVYRGCKEKRSNDIQDDPDTSPIEVDAGNSELTEVGDLDDDGPGETLLLKGFM